MARKNAAEIEMINGGGEAIALGGRKGEGIVKVNRALALRPSTGGEGGSEDRRMQERRSFNKYM